MPAIPPLPAINRFELLPMSSPPTATSVLDALLKKPGQILYELRQTGRGKVILILAAITIFCLLVYGVVVGSLSGGTQLWAAPVKLACGTIISVLICLPSLYIFTCLSGADLSLRQVAGILTATVCLISLLLIGFAPVAWVFSQSTDSIVFMGFLHLLFWVVGVFFGLRLLMTINRETSDRTHLRVWALIFVVVCLQMTTALRPIVGTSQTFLPQEKKFFVVHWLQTLFANQKNLARIAGQNLHFSPQCVLLLLVRILTRAE